MFGLGARIPEIDAQLALRVLAEDHFLTDLAVNVDGVVERIFVVTLTAVIRTVAGLALV